MGASLVSWNNAAEQLRIESYFMGTGQLPSYYWTGLLKQDNQYYWPDGAAAGNGMTSNANPYAHFPWDFQDRLASNPTYTFILAHTSWSYDSYKGNSSYLQMQQWQNYNFSSTTNKFGWVGYPSNQWAPFLCEKSLAMYDCDVVNAPPKLPPSDCQPTDNDTIACPDTLDSCYFWTGAYGNNATAHSRCAALGGYPVAWNSAQEQLTVETYFTVGATAPAATAASSIPCSRCCTVRPPSCVDGV